MSIQPDARGVHCLSAAAVSRRRRDREARISLSFYSPAPRPSDERERQRAVEASGILRAPPDPALHAIVSDAARLFDAPMAAVSVIDRDRQWFAARHGMELLETSRTASFCAYTILSPDGLLVIDDASEDDRFAGNPLVQARRGLRFYAGATVHSVGGRPLGALCVLDRNPRQGAELPLLALSDLARRASRIIADVDRGAQPAI